MPFTFDILTSLEVELFAARLFAASREDWGTPKVLSVRERFPAGSLSR